MKWVVWIYLRFWRGSGCYNFFYFFFYIGIFIRIRFFGRFIGFVFSIFFSFVLYNYGGEGGFFLEFSFLLKEFFDIFFIYVLCRSNCVIVDFSWFVFEVFVIICKFVICKFFNVVWSVMRVCNIFGIFIVFGCFYDFKGSI